MSKKKNQGSPKKDTRAQGLAKGGRRGGAKGTPKNSGKTPKSPNKSGKTRKSPTKRKATDIPEDEENTSPEKAQGSDEGASEDDKPKSPKRGMAEKMSRWTKANNTRTNLDGWSEEGKLVYEKIRKGLMEIPASAWSDVWKE